MQDIFAGGRHATVAGCLRCVGHWMRETDLQRLSEVLEPVLVEWRRPAFPSEQTAKLRCPECEGAPVMEKLQSQRDPHVLIDKCEHCGGVWLDANELSAIQQDSLLSLLLGLVRAYGA